jgi:putative endonuclease
MKDKEFYTGCTKNLKLRFEQHNKGLVESTRDRGPFKLVYYEAAFIKRMHLEERNI